VRNAGPAGVGEDAGLQGDAQRVGHGADGTVQDAGQQPVVDRPGWERRRPQDRERVGVDATIRASRMSRSAAEPA
jgi:hypothetical protein